AKGAEVGKVVTSVIGHLIENNPKYDILGIGVCVPGIVYSKKGTVWAPNIPEWDNYPLKKEIEDYINNPSIKICTRSISHYHLFGRSRAL
ncbi:MAG: ROK family protein, partial [Succinivibrio sp.]|nr:ROK family protein [Succinivibrio sp.]